MSNNSTTKVYGLSFPTRKSDTSEKKRIESVFSMEDSDQEKEEEQLKLKPRVAQTNRVQQAKIHRKTKSDYEKALEEDPSVFQYDEIYDDIKSEKERQLDSLLNKKEKQSKYVGRLLKTANERKLERELCQERKAQKEIEAEAELYGDKESFVTSAYKNKLTELRELVAKREAEQFVEKQMDVTTQDGLGGFYRYMYDHGLDRSSKDIHSKAEPVQEGVAPTTKASDSETVCKRHRPPSPSSHSPPRRRSRETSKERYHSPKGERVSPSSPGERSTRSSLSRTEDIVSTRPEPSQDPTQKPNVIDEKQSERQDTSQVAKSTSSLEVPTKQPDPNFIYARPHVTTDAEVEEAKKRYLQRRAEGIHAVIAESDSDPE